MVEKEHQCLKFFQCEELYYSDFFGAIVFHDGAKNYRTFQTVPHYFSVKDLDSLPHKLLLDGISTHLTKTTFAENTIMSK